MNLRLWVWGRCAIAVAASILLGVPAVAAPSAIKISQGVSQQRGGNPAAAAERAFTEGRELYQQGTAESLRKAIAKYEEAFKLFQAMGDRTRASLILNDIGSVYSALGEKEKALEYYRTGLDVLLGSPAVVMPSAIKISQGVSQQRGGNPAAAAAERAFTEGRELYQQGTAESLRKAIAKLEEALKLYREVGGNEGQIVSLLGLGRVYDDLGEKQKALGYYSQSLPLSRALGDRGGEANTLTHIGSVYSALGEKQKALDYYSQSLPLSRAVGDRSGEAVSLNNIGAVYNDLGQQQKALEYYSQSVTLRRAVGERGGEAVTLNNIGLVYSELGEKQKALEYYNQSLPLARAVGNRSGEAVTLNNIGLVYSDLGEKQKALE